MRNASSSLDLPPPYTLVTLREVGDAHAHACRIAAVAGAGTFVWARRFDVLDIAVVLEPAEKLAMARRAFFVAMTALADAVAAHCPPEKALGFDWPDTIRLDGARIGGGRFGWPADCREDAIPGWLVFSGMLMMTKPGAADSGLTPLSTSFEDEGFALDAREKIAESFARHLLLYFDRCESEGFAPIAANYLRRLAEPGAARRLCIADNGDLIEGDAANGGKRRRRAIRRALSRPAWLDAKTGSVRL